MGGRVSSGADGPASVAEPALGAAVKQFIQYTYDLAGNRTRVIEPGGGRFTCAYDSLNRLSTLENPQSQRTTFSYDDNSRRTASRLSNGSRASFTYDAASNITRLANLKSDLTTLSSFDYRYDKVNNRKAMIEGDGARTTYSYDNSYQLLSEFRTGSSAYRNTYTYDNAANRTLKNESGTRTTTTYDAANQINYALAAAGRTTYTYDADGNQQKALEPSGARTTTLWDYENKTRLTQLPSGVRNTMAYEPDGLRVKLQESAGEKRFIYDGQAYLLETDNSNVTTAVWTQEPTRYGKLISQRRGSTTSWYEIEANGSTRQLLDASQNVTDSYLYDAFGNIVSSSGSTVNPFQWHGAVGYYRDADTGLYYVRARILNPRIAIWTSTDPLPFVDGLNLYRLYFIPGATDPTGLAETVHEYIAEYENIPLKGRVFYEFHRTREGIQLNSDSSFRLCAACSISLHVHLRRFWDRIGKARYNAYWQSKMVGIPETYGFKNTTIDEDGLAWDYPELAGLFGGLYGDPDPRTDVEYDDRGEVIRVHRYFIINNFLDLKLAQSPGEDSLPTVKTQDWHVVGNTGLVQHVAGSSKVTLGIIPFQGVREIHMTLRYRDGDVDVGDLMIPLPPDCITP